MLTIQFNTGNAAFDGNYTEEVQRILEHICTELDANGPPHEKQALRDVNGNKVGFWIEDGVA